MNGAGMDRRVDFTIALAIVAGGLAWLYGAAQIHHTISVDAIGESGVPVALGILFVVGGVALAARTAVRMRRSPGPRPTRDRGDEEGHPVSPQRPLLIWATCLAWVLLMPTFGFLIATPVLLGTLLWLLESRRPGPIVALSLVTTAALFLLLDVALQVNLPAGPLAPLVGGWRL